MKDKREKIVHTVKKLIVHQQSAGAIGNREEAIAFGAKVAQLMREYRIEQHEVEPTVIDAMDFRDYGLTLVQAYSKPSGEVPWQAFLFNIIAESQACQCIVIRENGHFLVAGATLDRAVTCGLASAIATSIDRISAQKWYNAQFSDPAVYLGHCSQDEYETSFRTGFMQALQQRLREEEQASGGTALIVIGNAIAKTSKYLATKMRDAPAGSVDVEIELRHQGAAEEGYEAGMQADLNTNRIAGVTTVGRKEIGQ